MDKDIIDIEFNDDKNIVANINRLVDTAIDGIPEEIEKLKNTKDIGDIFDIASNIISLFPLGEKVSPVLNLMKKRLDYSSEKIEQKKIERHKNMIKGVLMTLFNITKRFEKLEEDKYNSFAHYVSIYSDVTQKSKNDKKIEFFNYLIYNSVVSEIIDEDEKEFYFDLLDKLSIVEINYLYVFWKKAKNPDVPLGKSMQIEQITKEVGKNKSYSHSICNILQGNGLIQQKNLNINVHYHLTDLGESFVDFTMHQKDTRKE